MDWINSYLNEQEVPFNATKIIDYPGFRQSTKYSCGVSEVQSALIYCFGKKYDSPESEFFKKLHTTEAGGTDPNSIVSFLKSKGVKVESKVLSQDELKECIDNDQPVIVCLQAWGKQKDYTNVYKEGHYATAIGYNDKGFIFEDPSISARYGFIPYSELDDRWHDVDKDGKKYDHLGIIIKCHKKYNPSNMEVIEGKKMSWIDTYLNDLNEAGFTSKPKGWTGSSVKKYTKTFTKKMKGNAKSEGFFDKCVKKMQGKVDNPEGFCASLKDEAHGSTYWRGKDKTPKEVKKDVATHKNVKEDDTSIHEGVMDKVKCKYWKFNVNDSKKTIAGMIKQASDNCRKTWGHRPKALNHCLHIAKTHHTVKFQQKLLEKSRKKRDQYCYGKTIKESDNHLLENFLQSLYTDNRPQAKEWRGANIPYGDEDDRPNLVGKCMSLEGARQKINCLRKLRDQAAMNPQYQTRLDRFVDAITGYYEPTDQQGTIPGNEFKQSNVGEDM